MNELKREIEEALAKAAVRPDGIIIKEESKYFPLHWYFEKGNEELRDHCLYWIRQLLDENQDLKLRLVRLSKVLSPSASELQALRDENQALHKERDFYKEDRDRCERLERKAYEQLETQAKEIEELREESKRRFTIAGEAVDQIAAQAKEIEFWKDEAAEQAKQYVKSLEGLEKTIQSINKAIQNARFGDIGNAFYKLLDSLGLVVDDIEALIGNQEEGI